MPSRIVFKLDIEKIFQITTHAFFGCICPMLRFTFGDDMEALLSQLRNISLLVKISRCDGLCDENNEIFIEGEHA